MASASGFLQLQASTKRHRRRRRTGEQIHLPSLPTMPSPTPTTHQYHHQPPRPRSRGHIIHGTDKEISFDRARQMLRLVNEDTPPQQQQQQQQQQHKRRGRRRRKQQPKKKTAHHDPNGISSLISDVWALQANKPNWMIERPPTVAPVVIEKVETPLESLTVPSPTRYESPTFINKVHQTLKLHPKASHLERSLLELHLQGAGHSEVGEDTTSKVVQWFKHRYPILLQRDQYVENKAVTSIGKAWRAYQCRIAFHEMLCIQRNKVWGAITIQRYWRARALRMVHAELAYEMSPTIAVVITRLALQNVAKQEVQRLEELRYKELHAKEIEHNRRLKERDGLSKVERLKRNNACLQIQSQWNVYCWRKSNDLFFMYKKMLTQNAVVIQKFIRQRHALYELRTRMFKKVEQIRLHNLHLYNAAGKIQRCWYQVRGHRWRSRMVYAIDVRDLLGADEDLPWERTGLVKDFFQNNDFGKAASLKYYTGGVYSIMGNFAPNTHLSEGQRWTRVRDARTSLASVYHSVGRLNLANKLWTTLVEESLLTEWETRSKHTASIAPGDSEEDNEENNEKDEDDATKGQELFRDLVQHGPQKQLNGRTISFLIHLCLTYQCQGKFEQAEQLLRDEVLGAEYEKMMVKVRAADAFYRKLYLTKHLDGWKEVCQQFLWKRQHALKLFLKKMMGISANYFLRWMNFTKSGRWYTRKTLRKSFKRYKQWLMEWKILRKLMGESHAFNIVQTKRTVVRRWFFQIKEWQKQRATMNAAFNHGRGVVLHDKFSTWKKWHTRTGHPWWVAQSKLNGLFNYWENQLRASFNWIRRLIFLEKNDHIEWATRCLQKVIRGKWGRKKAKRQERVKALHVHMQMEHAETLIVWGLKATIIQRWYQIFLRQRRMQKLSIQIRVQAEDRRLRLRKIRVEVQFYKRMLHQLGVVPYDHKKMKVKTRKQRERCNMVVKSAAKYMRASKIKLQKVINLFGKERINLKIKDAIEHIKLEGRAQHKTEEQITKDLERNKQFLVHEGNLKRAAAYALYRRKELFQIEAKKTLELTNDKYQHWKKTEKEFNALDEEGQVRNKIELLSTQWKNSACDRIVALFRGRHARLTVNAQLKRVKEKIKLHFWGALNVQTTWRRYKSQKVANMKRKRRDFLNAHPRVISLAKKTGRPLGFYEQEVNTVDVMAKVGLTEKRLRKIEEKMQFVLKPWWKRRIQAEDFDKLPVFIQNKVPNNNRPLPSQAVLERDKLESFFSFMHRSIPDFKMIHCPWKETTTMTFIKMKVAIKVVNAKAKFRIDGGIKHYHLFELLEVIRERGGSIVPAGKPTYFPKMTVLSPQTWGIWKVPMASEFGALARQGLHMEMEEDDIESINHGPTREELYYLALSEDGIIDRSDHGLAGLIGNDLLGVSEHGDTMRNQYLSASRGSDSGWSNAFMSEAGRDADELEEEDKLPDVEMPPERSALEIEKEQMKASRLLNMVRRLDKKKRRKRKKKKKNKTSTIETKHASDSDEEVQEESDYSDDGGMGGLGDLGGGVGDIEGGETKAEAEQLVQDMEEMELNAEELKRKKEDEEHRAHPVHQLPYCTACRVRNHVKREAQRLCHNCNLPYCMDCYRLSHRVSIYQYHRWTAYEHKLVTHAAEESMKEQHYEQSLLKHLARVNPRQFLRRKQITHFKWTDGLMQLAGQLFLDKDWKNTGRIGMGKMKHGFGLVWFGLVWFSPHFVVSPSVFFVFCGGGLL